ncbi:GGDEF domain-containing response regulator [Terriglobus albidus]|uniref:GGDEF domain-containing response regulator n=1 Tax=Terriglobus albidus TaxID=1592106 RepID=UPI0021DFB1AF|nr:diguanylate cyclase [Terriglobus albidus]
MRILVADDDAVSRRLMEKILTQSGYEVMTVADGRGALDALTQKDGPRMALLDWMMPGFDGPEVCRQIRARQEASYVYLTLLTSRQNRTDVIQGLEAGADDYLIKPCNPEELKARLRTGLRILTLEDKLVEAREEMRIRATHDALTGLLNRGAVLNLMKVEMARCRRERTPLSILLCDVDHFKQVNDVYGHLVGDQVLRELAERLKQAVRPFDGVGRYGGEEFVLVLGGCGSEQLHHRSSDILNAVRSKPIETSAGPLHITISAGAFTMDSLGWSGDVEFPLGRADSALYRAKVNGRNCVQFADHLSTNDSEHVGLPTVS